MTTPAQAVIPKPSVADGTGCTFPHNAPAFAKADGCGEAVRMAEGPHACGCGEAALPTTGPDTCGCGETARVPEAPSSCGCGEAARPTTEPDACGCGDALASTGEASSCTSATNAVSTEGPSCCSGGCACSSDHQDGMKPHEKVALAVAGSFVALGLAAEYLFANELFVMLASAIAIIAGLVIVLPETLESLKARSIDINVLMVVAIIGAVYVRAYEEAAAVLFLFSVGEYLEGRAMRKSNDAIKDLAKLAPDTALVVREGKTLEVPTDQVAKGETIVVKPGMSAPLDGIITKGSSAFNDAAVTGESIPVYKDAGDRVYAASLAVDGF
ncbi:MAG: hypothetical protein LBG81_03220, partial [Coriobacteriaceae bacterium]|nr:hypothetical protein [Coriobacteriaceae bacterium]